MSILLQSEKQEDRGLWSYISASRLNLWSKCPLAFRFRYVDGIVTPTNVNLFLGKVVHAALEAYYRHRQIGLIPNPDDAENFVQSAWEMVSGEDLILWNSEEDSAKCRDQAVGLVQAYIKEYADQPERIIAMESSLETSLVDPDSGEDFGIPLFGIVDLVLEQDGVLTLVDFKTAASASMICEQSHAVQLTLYSLLLQGNGYQKIETEIRQLVKTKTPKICTHRFGERNGSQIRQFFGLCREYLDSLDQEKFTYRPGWSCNMCDYRAFCMKT